MLSLALLPTVSKAQMYDFEAFNGEPLQNLPKSFQGNKSITIKNLYFGSGDTLWIGTYKNGLIKWWQDNFSLWEALDALSGNEVYHIVELKSPYVFFTDYDGFTDTYHGLYRVKSTERLNDTTAKHIPYFAGNPARPINKINDMTTMGDSMVLLTTDSGLVTFNGFTNWSRTNPDNSPTITEWSIDQVATTSSGGIYLSSGNNVYRKFDKGWEHIKLAEEPYNLKNTRVKQMRVGPNDTVWAITSKGVAKIHKEGGYTWLNEEIKANLNEVKDVVFDINGLPWMIFELNGGLRFLVEEDGKQVWHQVNSTNSDLPDELSAIAIDSQGDVWLGTDSEGMFKYLSYTPGAVAKALPNTFSVYPNPSRGLLHIENKGGVPYELALVDMAGKSQTIEVSLSGTSLQVDKGVYMLVFKTEKDTYQQRLIVY